MPTNVCPNGISELQRKTDPWARGPAVRQVACFEHFRVSVNRDELAAWHIEAEREALKKGKRK
jgi:hypothetical protein